jgi:hypothetical protein
VEWGLLAFAATAGFVSALSLIENAIELWKTRGIEDAPDDYTDGFCPVHLRRDTDV